MNQTPFQPISLDVLKDLFSPKSLLTFLVGAGISMNPPSSLPSARAIVKEILELCCPPEEVQPLLRLDGLRYELVVGAIEAQDVDGKLDLMDYFELPQSPNLLHYFVAQALQSSAYLITTNFDYLIELACTKIMKDKNKIVPVITKQDFIKYPNPSQLIHDKKIGIYKLHGSKRNFITNQATPETMITTISSLGKDREAGQTFAIEPFKKPAMLHQIPGRTLVVMGYSGSDDFDISPTLRELPNIQRIIWINHNSNPQPTLCRVQPLTSEPQLSEEKYTHAEMLLIEKAKAKNIEIYRIDGDTITLTRDYLWKEFLPKVPIPNILSKADTYPAFKEWYASKLGTVNPIKKFHFTCDLYESLGQHDKGLQIALQGKTYATEKQDYINMASFCNWAGLAYTQLSKWPEAIAIFKEGLEAAEKTGLKIKKMALINNLALIYHNRGEYEEEIKLLLDALSIADSSKDLKAKGNISNNLARIYSDRGNYDEAIKLYQVAISIAEKHGDLNFKAVRLSNLALVYLKLKNYNLAKKYYEEALAIAIQIGDPIKRGHFLNNLGSMYYNLSQYTQAQTYFEQALTIASETGDIASVGVRLNNLGSIHDSTKDFTKALVYYGQALEIANDLHDLKGKANRLGSIASIYIQLGSKEKGLAYLEEGLALNETLGLNPEIKMFIKVMAPIYEELKQPEKMIACYRKLIAILDKEKNWAEKGIFLNKLGVRLYKMKKCADAIPLLEECVRIDDQQNNLEDKSSDLDYLAASYKDGKLWDKAITAYLELLGIKEKLQKTEGTIELLEDLAFVYSQGKKWNDALLTLQKALAQAEAAHIPKKILIIMEKVGKVQRQLKQLPQAIMTYEQLIHLYEQKNDLVGRFNMVAEIGYIFFDSNQLEKALEMFQSALLHLMQLGKDSTEEGQVLKDNIVYIEKKLKK